jgi:tetratricopeptide (TPR) repeat protein
VAVARSRFDDALAAYGEAARIAPDRALPLVGIGAILARLGKTDEALAAFDAALERAPSDEAALRGRTDLLARRGERAAAAATLDRLAAIYDATGRLTDATETAGRALELAESRSRRALATELAERLQTAAADDPAAAETLARLAAILRGEPAQEPEPEPEPFDPLQAAADVEAAVAGGDRDTIRAVALAAAVGHRAAGQPAAAIDACYVALWACPDDPDLHLTLAEVYLDRGWRALATDKLVLLGRLADLSDDTTTRTRLCRLAAERLPDEPRLGALCA